MTNEQDSWGNIVAGTILGALVGAGIGLSACIVIFDDPPFFTGDTILIGAIVCVVFSDST